MASDRSVLEREIERVEVRPFTLEGFHRRRQRKERNRRIGTAVVALALAAAGIGGVARTFSSGTVPAGDPRSPFVGTWISTDLDGSTPTMVIQASGGEAVEIVVHDDLASVCSGASSTMTGTGRLEGDSELVIPSPVLTCDDGSQPEALSGPPLEEQLRNMTFVQGPESDTLTDSFGVVWRRPGVDGSEPLEGLDGSHEPEPWDPSRFGGTWESTDADAGFLGTWEATDVDASSLLLGVRASEASDTFEVLLLDDRADVEGCPITMTGIGRVDGRTLAMSSQTGLCEAEPGEPGPHMMSGDQSFEVIRGYSPLVHDPETDTLVGPTGVVWHRRPPGSDPIAVPFWGVWPQSSLEEAEEAQRRADAGDPAFTWQLAPKLATPPTSETFRFPYSFPPRDTADGAEILARFFRDVLGWERYVTVARSSPPPNGEGPGWGFVRIRCGPGRNPLYPNDPHGGNCPPTIGDSRYETVWVTALQPIESGPSGIWVVTGWMELAPSGEPASDLRYHEWVSRQYEQVVPPTEAEVAEAVEAFLGARVAGEGAEPYLTEGFWQPRPRVPLLYATTEGHRYERFEIGSVKGPTWPAGIYRVTVQLFARGGEDVVEETLFVWPGSRGQLTMDPGRSTEENGEPVPFRFGSGS